MSSKFGNKKRFKIYFELLILIICSIIGVGFISGAEIYQFFAKYYKFFWLGEIVFFMLVFILSRKIFITSKNANFDIKLHKNNEYSHKNSILFKNKVKTILIFFDVLMISSAMISGLRNMIYKLFNNNHIFIFLACVFVVFVLLCVGIKGLSKFDYLVIVFACAVSVLLFATLITNNLGVNQKYETPVTSVSGESIVLPIVFAALYVFMNIISIEPVIREYSSNFSRKSINVFCLILSLVLTAILTLFILFMRANSGLSRYAMPLLEYFSHFGNGVYIFYVFGLFLALISSLLGCLVGVKRETSKFVKNNVLASGLCVVVALTLGMIDFSVFVSIIYPIIGAVNFIVLLL